MEPQCTSPTWSLSRRKKSNQAIEYSAAAKSLQSCPTLCDPIDGSPPGSPPLGFSRQEHWSGLPFPFPMHESEKWKWSRSVLSNPQRPHGLQPSKLLRPWGFPGRSTGVGCHCLLREYSGKDHTLSAFVFGSLVYYEGSCCLGHWLINIFPAKFSLFYFHLQWKLLNVQTRVIPPFSEISWYFQSGSHLLQLSHIFFYVVV